MARTKREPIPPYPHPEIPWTKAQRKKLGALRFPHKADPKDPLPTAEAGWKILRERHLRCVDDGCTYEATADYADLLAEVLAEYQHDTPPVPGSAEKELMRAHIALTEGPGVETSNQKVMTTLSGALMALWFHQGGWPLVQHIYLSKAPFGNGGHSTSTAGKDTSHTKFTAASSNPNGVWHSRLRGTYFEWRMWPPLHRWVLALPEADYAAARAVAAEARAEALKTASETDSMVWAQRLGLLFSREDDWVSEDVARYLSVVEGNAAATYGRAELIMAGVTDPEQAMALAKVARGSLLTSLDVHAFDMVESMGAAAKPVLEFILAAPTWSKASHQKPLKAAIALIDKGST
ncbi:MAG: hypothetical protein ACE366_23395 [Bradymonadia bacterium]